MRLLQDSFTHFLVIFHKSATLTKKKKNVLIWGKNIRIQLVKGLFKTMHYLISTYYMLVLAYKRGLDSPLQVAFLLDRQQ